MPDETEIGSAGTPDRRGYPPGSGELSSPFQARAQFFKNWSWESVVSINRGACERGRAQHGINSEARTTGPEKWESLRTQALTLAQATDELRGLHRLAPFLFFNGNTFATIGRELALAVFSDLPPGRKREAGSAIAHYIAGVLERDSMVAVIESLVESTSFAAGDRVKTLRGSTHGRVLRVLEDGRLVWQPDESSAELTALPESLVRDRKLSRN
jgi:hypothetical protein